MGFWSGFEGLTGHRPGAFKGFSFKDILDDDLWKRHERLGGRQSRQFEETGVVPTTAWYRGRGRPEMMGPRVGAVSPQVQLNPAEQRASNLMRDQGMQAVQESQRVGELPSYAEQHAAIMRNRYPGGQTTVSAARPWPNIQAQMLRDPLQGAGSMRIPTQELMGEKTTVKKVFADPNKSDEIVETIKEKVPTGSAQWGNSQHPPNWMSRLAPTSLLNIINPSAWQDVARRKWEERMRARRGY